MSGEQPLHLSASVDGSTIEDVGPVGAESRNNTGLRASAGGSGQGPVASRTARRIKFLVVSVGLLVAIWWPIKSILIYTLGVSELTVARQLILQRFGLAELFTPTAGASVSIDMAADQWRAPAKVELDESIIPFRQIGDRLGHRALGNNIFVPRGAAVFDSNGDGRLDLYLPHSGRPVAKGTTADHVLTDEMVEAKPCTLFLNLGNDANGDPIFRSVQDLQVEGNDQHVGAELLIENKYRPRSSVEEDEGRPGRIGQGAVAADFNGDGRIDLYVFNTHYGIGFQTHELGLRVYPARQNLGRGARGTEAAVVTRVPSFLWGERSDGSVSTVNLGEGPEAEGRNSFYLNLGDSDGDGIPEWHDATDELGVGGRWATMSAGVADFDRDGDLDLYVANFLDPDFWGFGASQFAGNRNQLYVNQLAETGRLGFRNMAEELAVAGLHHDEELSATMWSPSEGKFIPRSEHIVEGRQVGETADHSWATMFADWNQDGWPDLVVANDLGNRLRVYENQEGQRFRYIEAFDEPAWDGCWMGMSMGDLDGDLSDDIMLTNCGSQVMSVRNNGLFIEDSTEANVTALGLINYPLDLSTLHHVLLSYRPEKGSLEATPNVLVHHSPYIPPDMSIASNFSLEYLALYKKNGFAASLASLEFAWNAPMLDVDNDGDLDIYLAGSLARGNDNFIGDWSGSPGRLIINESMPGRFVFRDQTLEYRLLDITDIDYSSNPFRRPSPGTGWHKRDYIYLTDTDGYSGMGVDASKSAIHDIFRMHEAANAVLAGDLNNDGFEDLIVTHAAGYDSLSPEARNLKVEFAGRTLAVPAPNKVNRAPTSFEEGKTFMYINGGAPRGRKGHWTKIQLIDKLSHNVYGIGARVVVNGALVRHLQIGGTAFGATTSDLNVGLGDDKLRSVEIVWPGGSLEKQVVTFDTPVKDEKVCIDRQLGRVSCSEGAAKMASVSQRGESGR